MINLTFQDQISPSRRDLELRSNFDIDVFRSTCICFDAPRCEKCDGGKIIPLSLLDQRLLGKNRCFCQQWLFWQFLTSRAFPVRVRSIPATFWRKKLSSAAVKIYANCLISEHRSVTQCCSRARRWGAWTSFFFTELCPGTLMSPSSAVGVRDCWLVSPTRATVSRMASSECSWRHS